MLTLVIDCFSVVVSGEGESGWFVSVRLRCLPDSFSPGSADLWTLPTILISSSSSSFYTFCWGN